MRAVPIAIRVPEKIGREKIGDPVRNGASRLPPPPRRAPSPGGSETAGKRTNGSGNSPSRGQRHLETKVIPATVFASLREFGTPKSVVILAGEDTQREGKKATQSGQLVP